MKMTISLKTKITIVFIFLFTFLILAVIPFYEYDIKTDKNLIYNYERLVHYAREKRLSQPELITYFNNLGFSQVEHPEKIFNASRKPTLRRDGFELLTHNERYYLHILTPRFRVLFLDNTNKVQRNYLDAFLIIFVFGLFIFIYYLIIKNINATEHQLKSRQFFLRTVMHELKTPIAKGRIVSELIDDEKQKNRIITIFEKLNLLIDNFAKVEQIVSKNYTPNIYHTSLENAVKKSIAMLMLENSDNVTCENISSKKINVDLELFAMALKNLIDNGLKYSTNTKVIIRQEGNQLHFISLGDQLPKPLDAYFKPFHNESKRKNYGMGLGLYIVHSILQMHSMRLKYTYVEGKNIFIVNLKK